MRRVDELVPRLDVALSTFPEFEIAYQHGSQLAADAGQPDEHAVNRMPSG